MAHETVRRVADDGRRGGGRAPWQFALVVSGHCVQSQGDGGLGKSVEIGDGPRTATGLARTG
jgi:hypothetical protein